MQTILQYCNAVLRAILCNIAMQYCVQYCAILLQCNAILRTRDTTRGGVHAPRTSGRQLDAARLNSGYLMTPIKGSTNLSSLVPPKPQGSSPRLTPPSRESMRRGESIQNGVGVRLEENRGCLAEGELSPGGVLVPGGNQSAQNGGIP